MKTVHWRSFCTLAFLSIACADPNAPPRAASSADSVGYAKQYPTQVERLTKRQSDDARAAEESIGNFSGFVDALKDPDWTVVAAVYENADEEGRGQAYADQRAREATVARFYDDERKAIVGRVAGAAQHAAKEKSCDVQLYGPVDWSLEKAVTEGLEDQRHEGSDAHTLVNAKTKELGPRNTKALEEQADQIALASHVAHVGAASTEHELRQLVAQSSDAKRSLERQKEQLTAEDKPSKATKEELARIDDALVRLDPAVAAAEKALASAEQDRLDLQEKYDKALRTLQGQVSDLQAAAETKADAGTAAD